MLSAVRAFDKGGSLKRLDPDELDSSFSSNSSTDPLSKATGFMALGEASLYPLLQRWPCSTHFKESDLKLHSKTVSLVMTMRKMKTTGMMGGWHSTGQPLSRRTAQLVFPILPPMYGRCQFPRWLHHYMLSAKTAL